jgi:hypothetical protein
MMICKGSWLALVFASLIQPAGATYDMKAHDANAMYQGARQLSPHMRGTNNHMRKLSIARHLLKQTDTHVDKPANVNYINYWLGAGMITILLISMMAKKSRQRWHSGRRRNSSQRDDSDSTDDDEEKKTPLVKWDKSPAKFEAWQNYIETRCREDGFALCILNCWFTDPDPERAEMEETILRRSSSIGLGDRATNISQLRRATLQVKNAQNAVDVISSRYVADLDVRRRERNIIWQENKTNDKKVLGS